MEFLRRHKTKVYIVLAFVIGWFASDELPALWRAMYP